MIDIVDYQKDTNKLADSNSENRVYKKGGTMTNTQAASEYVVKWAVNRMYCVILKDGKFIRDDRGQPKRFRNTKVANNYIRKFLKEKQ